MNRPPPPSPTVDVGMHPVPAPTVDTLPRTPAGRRRWGWLVARGLGAIAIMVTGVVHLQQYLGPYRAIPTIGVLFVVDFLAAITIGAALLTPIEHLAGRRAGAAMAIVTVAGITLAAGSFVMLTISQRTPLFGFQEPGYDPAAIDLSRRSEVAAVVLLGTSLLARFATKTPKHRW
jgi:hypothetical protein